MTEALKALQRQHNLSSLRHPADQTVKVKAVSFQPLNASFEVYPPVPAHAHLPRSAMAARIASELPDIRAILAEHVRDQPTPCHLSIMDVRHLHGFLEQRLCGAVHVPPDNLVGHLFWLPDKHEPFGIVLPADSNLPIEEAASLPVFLHSRGWTKVAWCLRDCPALWDTARELGLWEGGAECGHTQPALLQRFAFKGCPLLMQEVDRIEQLLMLAQSTEAAASAPGCGAAAIMPALGSQEQGPATSSGHRPAISSGYEPGTSSSLQDPGTSSGYRPASTSMQEPGTSSGYRPGTSSKLQEPGTSIMHQAGSTGGVQPGSTHGGQEEEEEQEVALPGPSTSRHGLVPPSDVPSQAAIQGQFRCLEPGCGSGRNIVWLAARRALHHQQQQQQQGQGQQQQQQQGQGQQHQQQQQGDPDEAGPSSRGWLPVTVNTSCAPQWSVVGIDSWYAALTRTQDLCRATLMPPDKAQFWYGSIDPTTGSLEPLTISTTTKHAAGAACNTHIRQPAAGDMRPGQWHLILCVRFLERSFLQHIPSLLAPGGILLYNTFVDMEGTRKFGRPKGSNHLLQRDELSSLFGPDQGFEVLRDDISHCRDGRELSMFMARKMP